MVPEKTCSTGKHNRLIISLDLYVNDCLISCYSAQNAVFRNSQIIVGKEQYFRNIILTKSICSYYTIYHYFFTDSDIH